MFNLLNLHEFSCVLSPVQRYAPANALSDWSRWQEEYEDAGTLRARLQAAAVQVPSLHTEQAGGLDVARSAVQVSPCSLQPGKRVWCVCVALLASLYWDALKSNVILEITFITFISIYWVWLKMELHIADYLGV